MEKNKFNFIIPQRIRYKYSRKTKTILQSIKWFYISFCKITMWFSSEIRSILDNSWLKDWSQIANWKSLYKYNYDIAGTINWY